MKYLRTAIPRMNSRVNKPERTCAICRAKSDKDSLIRIVRSPEGRAVIDTVKKLPGRGVYICPDEECISKAEKGRLSAILGVSIGSEFWPELREFAGKFGINAGLKVRSILGLSRKSGQLIIGQDNIERERRKVFVLTASDSSEAVREFARKHDNIHLDMNIEELSRIIGLRGGVQIVALPVNSGFARKIISLKGDKAI